PRRCWRLDVGIRRLKFPTCLGKIHRVGLFVGKRRNTNMDPRKRLAELAQGSGSSLAALSRMLGRNASYLQQYITKGSPRKLEEDDRRKLAQFFGVSEAELGAGEGKSSDSVGEWVDLARLSVEA